MKKGDIFILIAEPIDLINMAISEEYHHMTGNELQIVSPPTRYGSNGDGGFVNVRGLNENFTFTVLLRYLKKKHK